MRRAIRRQRRLGACAVAGMVAVLLMTEPLPARGAAAKEGLAYSIAIAGAIDQAAARDLELAIDDARRRDASIMIVRLDTRGGRGDSMRAMVKTIAAAPLPVIVYVHPTGASADSAGLFLTLAGDVAAMAPGTNIGSATPVFGGPAPSSKSEDQRLRDLRRKELNSGVGLARALAEDHGRNADLAERMIRTAENISATRARRARLIDVLASSEQALLDAVDGFTVKGRRSRRLQTSGVQVKRFAVESLAPAVNEDYDESSWLRSFVYLLAGVSVVALVPLGVRRGRSSLRRWRRKRRWRKRQRG